MHLCPVQALISYVSIRSSARGPLFVFLSGTPLTRSSLVSHVQAAFESPTSGLYRPQLYDMGSYHSSQAGSRRLPYSVIGPLEKHSVPGLHQDPEGGACSGTSSPSGKPALVAGSSSPSSHYHLFLVSSEYVVLSGMERL